MRKISVALFLVSMAFSARAEHTRVTHPNVLGVEMLGRAGLFSVQYDRVMNDDMAAGFGYGTVGLKDRTSGADIGQSVKLVPVYFNYYFKQDQGSLYGTGGATIILDSNDAAGRTSKTGSIDFGSGAVLPVVGFGYENRGDSGFLFRVTGYATFADKVIPWVGFTFGHAF